MVLIPKKRLHRSPSCLSSIKSRTRRLLVWLLVVSPLWVFKAHADLPIATVQQERVDQLIRLDATVEAVNQATLAAQTAGQIVEMLVDAGDAVPAGAVLLRLKDDNQRAELEAAEAAHESANANFNDALKQLVRVKKLLSRGLTAQQAVDSAQARFDITQAQREATKARVSAAREQLRYTVVTAPYAGIVLERHVDLGQVVGPGTPLFTGTSLNALRVVTQIPQTDFEAVRNIGEATILLPDGRAVRRSGDQIRFFAYASAQTGAFKVRVSLPEDEQNLYPGMYLKVAFKLGEREALVIPEAAVIARAELRALYVMDEQNELHFRQVRPGGLIRQGEIEILSGLSSGERIVLDPQSVLQQLSQQLPSH